MLLVQFKEISREAGKGGLTTFFIDVTMLVLLCVWQISESFWELHEDA